MVAIMLTRPSQKVTCVHKANIMKLGDGLFLNTFRRVAEEYKSSGITYNDMIVDNTFVSASTIV
jgi:isocitrate dehydrogenase (NAD+)